MIQIAQTLSSPEIPARSASFDPARSSDGRFGRMIEDLSREPRGEERAAAVDPTSKEVVAGEEETSEAAATESSAEEEVTLDASEDVEAAEPDPSEADPAEISREDLVDLVLSQFEATETADPTETTEPVDMVLAAANSDLAMPVDESAESVERDITKADTPVIGIAKTGTPKGAAEGAPASGQGAILTVSGPDDADATAAQTATPAASGVERAAVAPVPPGPLVAQAPAAQAGPRTDAPAQPEIRGEAPEIGPVADAEIRIRRAPAAAQTAVVAPTIAPAVEARLALASLAGEAKPSEADPRRGPDSAVEEIPILGASGSASATERVEMARPSDRPQAAPQITLSQNPGFGSSIEAVAASAGEVGSADSGFAPEVGSSRGTTASQQILHPAAMAAERPAAAQVAQIAEAVRGRDTGLIEVALSPEELGRVKITMQRTDTGFQIVVLADRDDTLNLLRRNGDMLESAFRELDMGDVNLSFGQNSQGRPAAATVEDMIIRSAGAPLMPEIAMPRPAPLRSSTGLDRLDMKI
ncbi:flagellar hook-length control protein FliK [Palleronia sp. LCG004]|uniref:flagellar hook-length control protein FliK n=1 Tax=Palleronia sp. LCG004 TaxID=3079304 RepID=UPI002942A942|nr:flagellar hook-length control protein FliK [Palleronia sp. LCG004]WOI56206.1 flagellar hook-length control protein FliK [Palleronia sp. LCG004]